MTTHQVTPRSLSLLLTRPGLALPGDVLALAPGDYDMRGVLPHTEIRGLALQPANVKPGVPRPVLLHGFHLRGDDTVLRGLDIAGEGDYGIYISPCKGARVEGCHIHDVGNAKIGNGIVVAHAVDCEIVGNLIGWAGVRMNTDHGIYIRHTADEGRVTIRNNVIWEPAGFGIHAWDEGTPVGGLVIEDNICFAPYSGNLCVDALRAAVTDCTIRGTWSISPQGTRRLICGLRVGLSATGLKRVVVTGNLVAGAEHGACLGAHDPADVLVEKNEMDGPVAVDWGRDAKLGDALTAAQGPAPASGRMAWRLPGAAARFMVAVYQRGGEPIEAKPRDPVDLAADAVRDFAVERPGQGIALGLPRRWDLQVDLSGHPEARGAWTARSVLDLGCAVLAPQSGKTDDGRLPLVLPGYDYEPEVAAYVLEFAG